MPQRPPAIILGTPSPGMWMAQTAVDAISATVWATLHGLYIEARGAEGAYTESNRNNIVRAALNYEHPIDAIMWIDSDMRFPADTISRLWSHNRGIVGATYRERQEPYRYLGKFCDRADEEATEGLKDMELMPGGMILVSMAVYRHISPPWYKLDEDGLRDDYYFTTKAREAGFEVWCDMELTRKVRHRGYQEVGWFEEGEEIARREEGPRWKIFENPALKAKPTIQELEAILDDPQDRKIEVMPNGEIRVFML
jgi:hypothetical protein